MHSKLTLRIDQSLIKAAKKYSKQHGKSLSQLIADYFSILAIQVANHKETMASPPITQSLKGILKGSKSTEATYRKYLEDKYR